MTTVAILCYVGLAVAAAATVYRLVAGPSVPDRVVALDTLLYIVVMGIAVAAATSDSGDFLGVLVAAALLAFVGTTTVARFVERRGSE